MDIDEQIDDLESLAVVLASRDTSISSHMELCERLWEDPKHRHWLISAMFAKLAVISEEPDRATCEFLAHKIHDVFEAADPHRVPALEDLAEVLPAIIIQLPQSQWEQPQELWSAVLAIVAESFGLPLQLRESAGPPDRVADDVARLWIRAVLYEGDETLEADISAAEGQPGYEWLAGLRKALIFDRTLDHVHRVASTPATLSASLLAEKLRRLPPYERARFLLVHNASNGKEHPASPDIDTDSGEIEWVFSIPFEHSALLELRMEGLPVGTVSVRRIAAEDKLVIDKAAGLLEGICERFPSELSLSWAAATYQQRRLSAYISGTVRAAPEGIEIRMTWADA